MTKEEKARRHAIMYGMGEDKLASLHILSENQSALPQKDLEDPPCIGLPPDTYECPFCGAHLADNCGFNHSMVDQMFTISDDQCCPPGWSIVGSSLDGYLIARNKSL